jgi:translocator protein
VQARLPLILNMVVNFGWFVATQREWGGVSAGLLWTQFFTAVWLYYALEIPRTTVYALERLLRISVRLYVGWLTVANVVTAAYVLERLEWSGWGLSEPTWAVVMLVVASAIGLFARFAWRDPVYGGVFVWALVGVAVREGQPLEVVVTASLLALLFLMALLPTVRDAVRSSLPSTSS